MKIKLIILFAIAFSIMACENQENDFPDFGSTSVYFPFQSPIRTIIQGDYDLGFNENDNNGRFEIGVVMSGVYNNGIDRKVFFELEPELIDTTQLVGIDSVNVQLLPASHYTIEQESPVTIPAGSTDGRISVQLTDAFFDDPLSFAPEKDDVHYVIPLRITGFEQLDSLLTGVPAEGIDDPVKIRATDWTTLPKDYTLFGIKYMNPYEGIYLRRGEDAAVGTSEKLTVSSGDIETTTINGSTVYREEFVVRNETTKLTTAGRNKVIYNNLVRRPQGLSSDQTISLELTINEETGDIALANVDPDSSFILTSASGQYVEDGDEWGGEKRDVIYLEYEYQDVEVDVETVFGNPISETTLDLVHQVNDTLVIRDRDVKFEQFVIELQEQ